MLIRGVATSGGTRIWEYNVLCLIDVISDFQNARSSFCPATKIYTSMGKKRLVKHYFWTVSCLNLRLTEDNQVGLLHMVQYKF